MVNIDDLIGVPFVNGGRDVKIGLDCWGLVMEVFRRYGIEIPDFIIDAFAFRAVDTLIGEAAVSRTWEEVYRPSDGDVPLVVLMRLHRIYVTHAGVLLHNDRIIHTMENTNTVLTKVGLLKDKIVGYYRPCSQ